MKKRWQHRQHSIYQGVTVAQVQKCW